MIRKTAFTSSIDLLAFSFASQSALPEARLCVRFDNKENSAVRNAPERFNSTVRVVRSNQDTSVQLSRIRLAIGGDREDLCVDSKHPKTDSVLT